METEKIETEVVAKAKRRQYTRDYKLKILQELEANQGTESVGAILRREGLYSSLVSKWREQQEQGSLSGSGKRRGPKADANAAELARLQKENKRLQARLERAELIIEVQKKVVQLVGENRTETNEAN